MARRRRIALVLCACVAVGLADCSPPPMTQTCIPGQNFGGGFGTGGGAGPETIFSTGEVAAFTLESFASASCEPGWTVEGEVLDPQNLAVPAEFLRLEGFGGLANARVRFTPTTPGAYLVTARFEPALARAQRVVLVARNRLAEAPIVDVLPFDPGVCGPLFRTLRGAVVCQRSAAVVVVRSGGILESFPDTTANVVGNTVWLVTPQRLERRVDTGVGPLTLTGALAANRFFSANSSFFEDDRAIVLDNGNLRGPIVFDGARLVDEARPFLGGSGLLLGSAALSFDGDSVCDASADAGACARITPIGVQGDVLWTSEGPGQPLAYRAGRQPAASIFPISVFALVDPLVFPVSGSQTPRVRITTGEQLFTVVLAPGPELERWPWQTIFTRDFGLVGSTSSSAKWLRR